MEQLKQVVDQNYFNESKMLQKIMKQQRPSLLRRLRPWISLAFVLSLVLTLVFYKVPTKNQTVIGVKTPSQQLAYAIVSVDINPSFELYTDLNELVIEVKALNAEAQAMDTSTWIGQDIDIVIDDLIAQASALGYLNTTDGLTDYIVISTVAYGADGTQIVKTIQRTLSENVALDRSVKTYVLNASPKDYEEAESKHLSLGLYMLNGLISNNGTPMSVGEFAADPKNLSLLEEKAEHQSTDELKSIVQALISDLQSKGVDVSAFQARLNSTNVDLEELIEDIKDVYHQDGSESEEKSSSESEKISESSQTQTGIESKSESESHDSKESDEKEED